MGFIKKIADIFSKNQDIEFKWTVKYNEQGISLIPNKSLDSVDEIKDLLTIYEIDVDEDNSVFIQYNDIYDLYYDEFNNKIDIYKYFNLPDIFKGILEIENKNNFLVDEEVFFIFRFKGRVDESYKLQYGNILASALNNEYKVMPKNLFKLIEILKSYNKSYENRSDEASQFEMLKIIKDYAGEFDIKLNDRLRKEDTPIIIDKLKIDFNDDGETIEIYPKLDEDKEVNDKLLGEINSYKNIKGSYSTNINGRKKRYVIKHKETLENIIKNKKNTGEKRLEILSGRSSLFEDENIDISDFGPRVTGFGYLTYKSSSSNIQTNDLDWLDNNSELPYIQGTNINGDYENITLKPQDRDILKAKLVELNLADQEEGEVEFNTAEGNSVKIIMSKDDIKQEINNIESRIKTPLDIKKISDLENLIKICDKYKDEDYIPYKNIYISKEQKDIHQELIDQLEKVKSKENKENNNKKKTLLIAENLDEQEYKEIVQIDQDTRNVEIPTSLKDDIKLFSYQEDCLKKLQNVYLSSKINGFLLCDDMGLGKTLQLLSFLAWLKERNELRPSLIVAPSSLLNNWDCDPDGEIQKFFDNNYFNTDRVVGNIDSERAEELKNKDIVFITYESLRMNNVALGKIHWNAMICDEAQKIKSPRTLVTVAAKAQNANFKIICSATPIENTLEDLWTLVDFSKPGLLGSLKDFRNEYINNSSKVTEKDLEETNDNLYNKIEKFYLRREKNVLPKTLPKKIIKMYYIKPLNEEIEVLERIKDTEDFTISAIQKMLAICSHIDMVNENIPTSANIDYLISRSSKLQMLKKILADIKEKDEKVIIFTRLRKVQKIIYFAIKHWFNMEPYIVNGEEHNLDSRTKKINSFKSSQGFDVIILSPEVAGFGITITEANHVIHYTRLWNPAKEDQATDRVYRIGQTKDVTVHYPIISFGKSSVKEYSVIDDYVKENSVVGDQPLSPEEKLNILLARKKSMLLRFFLSAGNGDFSASDFRSLESDNNTKNTIRIDNNFNNIITPYEFESLIAVLYEKMGFKTYLTSRSNDKGVDVIAYNEDRILFIQCKHTLNKVGMDAHKDLLFARDIYKEYVDLRKVNGVIVTSSNNIYNFESDNIEVINREKLAVLLDKYKIFKDEVDVKDRKRYSFEELIRIL